MNCTEIKEQLSAFFDDEVSAEQHQNIQQHIEGCSECRRELAGFRRLSQLASQSTVSPPSAEIWQKIESELDHDDLSLPISESTPGYAHRRFVLAAMLLAAATVGAFALRPMFPSHENHHFAAEFSEYLDRFKLDPHDAQAFLLSKYQNLPVRPEEAIDRAGYRPIVADGLPDGYSLISAHVMKMPCCTCVQCLCQRSDGTTLAIFEHDDDGPGWFAGRTAINVICQSKQCELVELSGSMAASWNSGKRYVTVIGARDLGEIDKLVAWFTRTPKAGKL